MAKETPVLEETQKPALVRQLVSAPKDHWPEPKRWPQALLELLRDPRWPVTLADFGLTKSTLSRFADKADHGDDKCRAKLEPFKQFFLFCMGLDQHEREKYDENNKRILKQDPRNAGTLVPDTETRSRWGARDQGRDMYHIAETGPRPRPAHWKRLVEEYFYKIAPALALLDPKLPMMQHQRKSHTFEVQKEVLAQVLTAVEGSGREWALEQVAKFIDGQKSEWDGQQ